MDNMGNKTPAGGTDGTDQSQTQGQIGKTFTQDDVNRIVSERLSREKEKSNEELNRRVQELDEREKTLTEKEKLFTAEQTIQKYRLPQSYIEILTTSDDMEKTARILYEGSRMKAKPYVMDPETGRPLTPEEVRQLGPVVAPARGENGKSDAGIREAFGLK